MAGRKIKDWKIRAGDCYFLLEKQGHKCALSGLELTPNTTEIMHRMPIESGGENSLDNTILVDSNVYKLARGLTPDQLAIICAQILDNLCRPQTAKRPDIKKHIDSRKWRLLLSSQTNNFNKSVKRFREISQKSKKKYYHSWGEILSQKAAYFEKRLKQL